MTNKPEQKKQTAPKKGKTKGKAKKPKVKVKRVRQLGVFSILFMFFLVIIIFTFTPLYSIILLYVPESYQQSLFKDIFQNITLSEDKEKLSEPRKYAHSEPLSVLGDNTGICFYFYSTIENEDRDYIDAKRLDKAAHGKRIAEIIVVDDHKSEYSLNITTMHKKMDNNGNIASIICQKFGNAYPATPKTINAAYVRPLKPFTPYKVIWSTKLTIYED